MKTKLLLLLATLLVASYAIACDGDTQNPQPDGDTTTVTDGGSDATVHPDATNDSGTDTGSDSGPDAADGGTDTGDAGPDASDAGDAGDTGTDGGDADTDGGDPCLKQTIDPTSYLATMTLEAGATGTMTVALPAGDLYEKYNGSYLYVPAGKASKKATYLMSPAVGIDVPNGFYSLDLTGVEIRVVDAGQPYKRDGNGACVFNEISLDPDLISELFLTRIGTILFFNGTDWVFPGPQNGFTFELSPQGTLAKMKHFSPYYIVDSAPTLSVSYTVGTDNIVTFDFTGTQDESHSDSFLFKFSVTESVPVPIVFAGDLDHPLLWKTESPMQAGTHNLKVTVLGMNFNTSSHPQDKAETDLEVVIVGPDPCLGMNCNHGKCVSGSCVCDEGWSPNGAPPACTQCASGYHLEGIDCVLDQVCLADSCHGHGTCSIVAGKISCSCSPQYQGPTCASCASGYQDNNSDGSCEPTCATANLNCSGHGQCSDASGTSVCICDTGYKGSGCAECADGYQDKDSNGSCLPTCATANPSCQQNAHCDDASGTALCVCDNGYQDHDSNGSCLEACDATYCGTHGSCADGTGTRVCTCDAGWALPTCNSCASGYLGADCHRDWCAVNTCQNGGTCSNEACSCIGGFTGTHCENPPLPTVTITGLDCSSTAGWCSSGGATYPLTFTSTNASTFTASQTLNCGSDGTFSPANGNVSGSPMSINYTTAICNGPIVLKVEVCNATGCASDSVNVETY